MPKGPQGQKRKADVIGNAVLVMKLATGEAKESTKPKTAAETSGSKGGKRPKQVTAIILFTPFMHNWRGNRGRALRA